MAKSQFRGNTNVTIFGSFKSLKFGWRAVSFVLSCMAVAVCMRPCEAAGLAVRSQNITIVGPNRPVVFDIDADGVYEILLSGVDGRMAVYNSRTLKPIWQRSISTKAVTEPVVGDFGGTGAYLVAVCSSDGKVFFLQPGSGELVAKHDTKSQITIAPTVVPLEKYDETSRDGLLVCDDAGAIRLLTLHDNKVAEQFSVENTYSEPGSSRSVSVGRITWPASVGDITGDGVPEVIIGTVAGTVQAFSLNDSKKRYIWRAPQGTNISTNIAIGDFLKTGKQYLAFGASNGELYVLAHEPKEGTSTHFREEQKQRIGGPAAGHLIVTDIDKDGYLELFASSAYTVAGFDAGAGFDRLGSLPYASNTQISPLSVVQLAKGETVLLFGDGQSQFCVLDPTQKGEPKKIVGPEPWQDFAPAGNLSQSGSVEVVLLMDSKKKLAVAKLGIEPGKDSLPTMSAGMNFQRNSQWLPQAAERLAQGRERFLKAYAAAVGKAETALAARKYTDAYSAALEALSMSPSDAKAESILSKANGQIHWLRNTMVWLFAISAVGVSVLAGFQTASRRRCLALAQKHAGEGDYAKAILEYRTVFARQPRNAKIAHELARAYIESGQITAQAVDALEVAHRADPENEEVTMALAKAYVDTDAETDAALEVYLPSLARVSGNRGKMAFHAANIMRRRGNSDQAMKFYKLATREGYNSVEVHERLADVFIELNQFSEKTLPVFESVSSQHTNDTRFLEALCRAYAAARRADEKVRLASNRLLELKPDSVIALRLLAKCEIQDGHAPRAVEFCERARSMCASDGETITLLSHCYMALGRTDDPAIEVYRQALGVSPDQPDLLRVMALALLQKDGNDPEGYELLKRASAANPQDVDLLLGLAEAASKRSKLPVVVESLERAVALGRQTPEIYSRLAEAYAALGNASPTTERAYREALKSDPENPAFLRNLGRVLVGENRTDADTMIILEKIFRNETTNLELGRHLARTYVKNERYDNAIKLSQWLLQAHTQDEELQKLFAQASLNSNRLDQAIRQYELLVQQHPDNEAIVNLATAYAQKQRTDQAAAVQYQRALKIDPHNGAVQIAMAHHLAQAGDHAKALDHFRAAAKLDSNTHRRVLDEVRALIAAAPERSELRWFLANDLIEQGHLTGAMEELQAIFENDPAELKGVLQAYDRILAKDPTNFMANLHKGMLLKIQGRFEDAQTFLERAYRMSPNNSDAAYELSELYENLLREDEDIEIRFQLGKLYYMQKEFDKAISQFQRTAQDFRYETESIKMLGQCFAGKSMLEFALQEFKKLPIDDEMKELLYDLAQRYEAKNDLVGAKQVYRQLFAADINYKNVKMKFEMLAGSTSDPMALERTAMMTQLSEKAQRRYELQEELGRGAMGIVYKAKDNELDEIVALKILPENLTQNPEALQRFRAEARAARKLSHPNIVRIHDIGEEMGRKYISMEYVNGTDLKRYFRSKGKLPPKELATLMISIANALDYAHSMGIVHRDVKPANIMLTDTMIVKVSDFGIAKVLESTTETVAGAIIGTPLYMSPEQIQGLPIDNRADIYSLGIMMYELISGKPPFVEGDLAYQHTRVAPKPLADVPAPVGQIIMRCLEKDREQRFKVAGEVAKAFEKIYVEV